MVRETEACPKEYIHVTFQNGKETVERKAVDIITEDGFIVFSGATVNGLMEHGYKYDSGGRQLYFGGFKKEKYDGFGMEYHPSGKVAAIGFYKKGLRTCSPSKGHPLFRVYHKNGKLEYEGVYRHGRRWGASSTTLYANGQPFTEAPLLDGSPPSDGQVYSLLYSSGRPWIVGTFHNGKLTGPNSIVYHPNGAVWSAGPFENGRTLGDVFWPSGSIRVKQDADGMHVFHPNGHTALLVPQTTPGRPALLAFENDVLEDVTIFHSNGAVAYKGGMKGGKKHGSDCREFWPNGQLRWEGPCVDGGLTTLDCTIYNANGTPLYKGGMRYGLRHGDHCQEFYSDGQLCFRGGFVEGRRHGASCTVWNKNGSVIFEGEYHHGARVPGMERYMLSLAGWDLSELDGFNVPH